MNLKTPISHLTRFGELEAIAAENGLRLGPLTGAYPRRALKLSFQRLKLHSPRLTVKGFHKLHKKAQPAPLNHPCRSV